MLRPDGRGAFRRFVILCFYHLRRRDEMTGSTPVGQLSRIPVVPCAIVTLRPPRAVAPRVIMFLLLSSPARYAQIKFSSVRPG